MPAHLGHVGYALGDDVARALKVVVRRGLKGRIVKTVLPDRICQWLKSLLLGDHGARAALRLVGLVEILQGGLLLALLDLRAQVVRKLALLVDRLQDDGAPLFQLAVVGEALLYLRYLHLVEVTVGLLAVAGYERDRVALREQLRHGGDLSCRDFQFRRQARQHLRHVNVGHHLFK